MLPSLDDLDWPLQTARLTIRRATPEDARLTWPYRSQPAVADWLTRLPTSEAAYATWFADADVHSATLLLEYDGAVIGDAYLGIEDGWSQVEAVEDAAACEAKLGWVLAPEHQGRGLATEAVHALMATCFDQLSLRRVVAECFAANEPSWRLMERVGMRRETHSVRDGLHRTRGWLDGYTYALLAEEWATRSPGSRE